MPSLGTLVTVVTADTSGFTAGMNTAAQQAQQFSGKFNAVASENQQQLSRWGDEVDNLGERFTSLHGLIAIGFGVHLGRQLFTEIHKGLAELVSGFSEAKSAGESFGDSLLAGMEKAAGLETHIEMLNRHMKENARLAKEIGALRSTEEKIIGPPSQSLTEASKTLDAMEEKQKELDATAGEWKAKIAAAKEQIKQAAEREREGGFSFRGTGVFSGQEALGKAMREGGGAIQAAEEAQQLLNKAREDVKRLEEFAAVHRAMTGGPIGGLLGLGLSDRAGAAGRLFGGLPNDFKEIFKDMAEKVSKPFTGFGGAFGGLIDAVTKGAQAQAIEREHAAQALQEKMQDEQDIQNKRLEEKRKLENMPAQAHIGGLTDLHNALQMAALGPKTDKDLEELKKHTQHLKDANDKLKALNDKATPLVWA